MFLLLNKICVVHLAAFSHFLLALMFVAQALKNRIWNLPVFTNRGEEIVPSPLSHLSLSTLPESGDSPSKTLVFTLLSPGSSSQGSMIGRGTEPWEVLLTPQGKEGVRDDISLLNRDLIEMRVDLNR